MSRLITVLIVFVCIFTNLWGEKSFQEDKNFNVTFFFNETNPMGRYKEFADFGLGGGVWVDYILPGADSKTSPFKVGIGADYVYNFTNKLDFQRLEDYHWHVRAAFTFLNTEDVDLGVGIRFGGIAHMLYGTWNRTDAALEIFYDPYFNLDLEIKLNTGYKLGNMDIALFLVPGYQFFVEETYSGQQVIVKAGLLFAL